MTDMTNNDFYDESLNDKGKRVVKKVIEAKEDIQTKKIKVYIASPYTKGDTAVNVKRQIDMVDELMDHGLVPFAPLYTHFQHMVHPRPYEDWLEVDMTWVESCDCLLRLEGESSGADREVAHAKEHGKEVFYSVEDLLNFYKLS